VISKKISLKEAISIGIGGMVGGGIFAVLGLAVSLGKGGTPISFLFAGLIALITAYSYIKLSLAYPDKGGTVKFVNEGFGKSVFSGGLNNLLWISYIIMLALYASAFGSYANNLFHLTDSSNINFHIYASSIIIIATLINYYSITTVGKIESYAVIIKITILLIFVLIGAYSLIGNPNINQLSIENWKSPLELITAGMVIFIAYEGFELIANVAPNIKNPKKNIPRAYYYSVIFVIILYIAIAIITVGSLPFSTIEVAQDYVLAETVKSILGQFGFVIITITALISTFSAINATLYGGSRVSYKLGQDDELPHELTYTLWNQPIGLLITVIATLLLVNTLNLESISTAGSVGFLIIFAAINYVGLKLSNKIQTIKIIPLLGFILALASTITLITQQYTSNKLGVSIIILIIFSCFIFEFIYKKIKQ
jgi:amino acid transporter